MGHVDDPSATKLITGIAPSELKRLYQHQSALSGIEITLLGIKFAPPSINIEPSGTKVVSLNTKVAMFGIVAH
jgi:hypothetical protein